MTTNAVQDSSMPESSKLEQRMKPEHLITMANQIGDFFKSYPDGEQAKQDIVTHIKRFWALRMRQQIVAHVRDHQGEGLHPMVSEAIRQHSALLA